MQCLNPRSVGPDQGPTPSQEVEKHEDSKDKYLPVDNTRLPVYAKSPTTMRRSRFTNLTIRPHTVK